MTFPLLLLWRAAASRAVLLCSKNRFESVMRPDGGAGSVIPENETAAAGPGTQPFCGAAAVGVGGGRVDVGPGQRWGNDGDRGDPGRRAAGARVQQVLSAVGGTGGRDSPGVQRHDSQYAAGVCGVLDADAPRQVGGVHGC